MSTIEEAGKAIVDSRRDICRIINEPEEKYGIQIETIDLKRSSKNDSNHTIVIDVAMRGYLRMKLNGAHTKFE